MGRNEPGQRLIAINTISDIDGLGAFSYQWFRNDVSIIGATNSSYELIGDDVAKTIRVKITYVDTDGTVESILSSGLFIVSPPLIQSTQSNVATAPMLMELPNISSSTVKSELTSTSLSNSIAPVVIAQELHYSLDLFGQAIENKVPDRTLSTIAGNVFKSSIQDQSRTQVVGNMLQRAIDANESSTRIGFIASGILSAGLDVQTSIGVVAQTIVQQIVESNLASLEIAQVLSTMILESPTASRPDAMQAILTEPKITEDQLKQIQTNLQDHNSELAKEFSNKTAEVKKLESINNLNDSSSGLLSRLKARFFGDTQVMDPYEVTYSEQEHAFNIKLAKAKLMRFVA